MGIKEITKDVLKVAISSITDLYKESDERKNGKKEFLKEAKQICSKQDVLGLNVGDAVCVGEDFMGIVVSHIGDSCTAIPAYNKAQALNWYTHQVYMEPNHRRTDGSYMNSTSHWIITEAMSYDNGEKNQVRIKEHLDRNMNSKDYTAFPAIEYCIKKGPGYYLPSIGELLALRLAVVNESLSRFHADELIPTEGNRLYWSSTDDINREYQWLNDSYVNDSAAYALRVDSNGVGRKELTSKKESALVLPFYRVQF